MKSKWIELLSRSHDDAEETLADRDTDLAPRDRETWTASDVMVHITGWNRWLIEAVAAARGLHGSPIVNDLDAKNAMMLSEGRLLSRDQVFAEAERVQQELLAAIDALTDESLSKELVAGSHREPRLTWRIILGTHLHTIEHVKELLIDEGEPDAAVSLYRAAIADASEVFGTGSVPSAWTGYNLACVCARTGRLEEAITALREAVAIDAETAEWSHDDRDLDPLRGLPKFEELFAGRQ